MKNKKLVLAVAAFAAVIAVLAGIFFVTRPEATAGSKSITVTVVHKDGSEKVFAVDTTEEYLGAVLLGENIVAGEEGPYGLMIHAADGEVADWNVDQSYWGLFIGEEYATTGADGIALTDGGVYRLVYTIG